MKLTLETDYKINGNSTGSALDTLAIAVDGRDSNDIDEYQDGAYAAEQYVLDNYNYEADMLDQATKVELKAWLDPQAYNIAVDNYTNKARRDWQDDETTALAIAIQKARDDQADQNYKEWLHGDYRDWAAS